MSIPERSNGTWNIYLGEQIVCGTPCSAYDTSKWIILEWRLWRDSTSSRHWWIYIINNDVAFWIWHTSYRWRWIEFTNIKTDTSVTLNVISTWFYEYRLIWNRNTWAFQWQVWNTLDVWTALFDRVHTTTAITSSEVYVWMQSNDSYYHNWQFEWFRIKDLDWNIISDINFQNNTLPDGYTMYYKTNDYKPDWTVTTTWYTLSNWILTLSTNPYNRWLFYDTPL